MLWPQEPANEQVSVLADTGGYEDNTPCAAVSILTLVVLGLAFWLDYDGSPDWSSRRRNAAARRAAARLAKARPSR